MDQEIFKLTVGGQAGQGIKAAGLTFAKIATRSGKNVFTYTGFPSLIKGGHNFTQVSVSKREVTAPSVNTDFWICLDQKSMDPNTNDFKDGNYILFDESKNYDLSKINQNAVFLPVPLAKLAQEAGGSMLISNTVALGAALALLNGDLNILKDLLKEEFSHKGDEVVALNHAAASKGYDFALEHYREKIKNILSKEENIIPKMVANASDTTAFGAIAAGLQFASIYPMSPISNILTVLAKYQSEYGFVYKQPEDEISAINMSIGASFAGARSMTASSGGGFSLMTESYGLAGITETPLVIIEGMRPGPASGLPTWSAQGDLQFVLHASQGDFLRIVLAAGDAKEAFYLTMEAFNLADKYQTPVIVLLDKNILEDDQSLELFDISNYQVHRGKFTIEKKDDYQRYKAEEDGISERTIPGTGNFFISNSYEHNALGYDTEEIKDINEQMKKRMTKFNTCEKEDMQKPIMYGPENADITIVSWGSNKGSILEVLRQFPNVNFMHITWMNPFPSHSVKEILEKSKYIIDIEANYTPSLANLIREKTGFEIKDFLLKYDGRPIFPEEIIEKIKGVSL